MAINKNKINDNALKFIQKGQIKKAIREYEKILAEDPNDVRTLLKKGDLLVRVGDKEQAVDTYLMVAATYSQQGFHLKAVAVFKQILKIDNTRVDVNLHLAEEYQKLGIIGDAMLHLQIVANAYEQQSLSRESLDILRRIVELDPDNIASRIKLGEMYSREEMIPEAVAEFTRAAEDLKSANRIEDYIKVAERLIYHDTSNIALIKELANIYLQRGDTKRALGKLQICFKSDPRDLEVLGMLALAFQELNQISKTVSVYKEMAAIYREQGALDEMQQVYRRVLEIVPDDPDARQALSQGAPAAEPMGEDLAYIDMQDDQGAGGATMPTASVPTSPVEDFTFDEDSEVGFDDLPDGDMTVEQSLSDFSEAGTSLPEDDLEVEPAYIEDAALEDHEVTIGESLTVDQGGVTQAASAGEDSRETISRLLTETDVYIKYGLQNKAFDHLSKVFALDPNNIEAHQKLKDIYINANQLDHAGQELLTLIHLNKRIGRLDESRAQLRSLLTMFPDHPEGPALAQELGETGFAQPAAAGQAEPSEAADVIVVDQDSTVSLGGEQDLPDIDVEMGDLVDEAEEAPTMIADRGMLDYELSNSTAGQQTGRQTETKEFMPLDFDASEETVEASALDINQYPPADDEAHDLGEEFVVEEIQPELSEVPELIEEPELIEDAQLLDEAEPSAEPEIVELLDEPQTTREKLPAPEENKAEDELIEFSGEDEFFDQSQVSKVPETARPAETDAEPVLSAPAPPPPPPPPLPPAAAEEFEPETTEVALRQPAQPESEPEPVPEPEPEPAPKPAEAAADEDLEDSLEEIDFFIQQNLLDEASDEIERLVEQYPDNPEVAERHQKIQRLKQGESPVSSALPEEMEGPFDLAAEIEREVGDDVAPVPLDEDFQYSFDDVFSEFKKGVEKVVDKEDSATHYDLGIAYKEMGLVDDAISEFGIAAHDDSRSSAALNMIGLCFQEKGQYSEAINRFKDALHGADITEQAATGVYYEIGRTYEMLNDVKEALFYFKKVHKRDSGFRDVATKIKALSKGAAGKQNDSNDADNPGKASKSKSNISYM